MNGRGRPWTCCECKIIFLCEVPPRACHECGHTRCKRTGSSGPVADLGRRLVSEIGKRAAAMPEDQRRIRLRAWLRCEPDHNDFFDLKIAMRNAIEALEWRSKRAAPSAA